MTPPPPRELYLEVSNRCQSLCITCPLTLGGHEPRRDMTLAEAQFVIGQVPGLERVVLHGIGEPLLNAQLPEMVAWLSARHVATVFNTNAIGLTAARGRRLIDAGLTELRISLDAARRETYLRIRGVDAFDRVLRNLREFVTLRADQVEPALTVTFMAMRDNLAELADVVRICADARVDALNVQRLVFWPDGPVGQKDALYGRLAERERRILEAAVALAADEGLAITASGGTTDAVASLEGRAGKRSSCRRPWTSTYVTAHGKVLACCIAPFTGVPFDRLVLGDLATQTLEEVWAGEPYERLRHGLLADDPVEFCRGCGERWSV